MTQSMKKKFPSLISIDLESDGNTSFLRSARNGQLDKVLEHLKSNIDINTSNANGLNALHLASKDGHVEIVKELLKRGAVVDAATKKGNTALHIASLAGQEEVVKLLVQHGASVNVQSQNGFTPLYMAAQENHDNVVKYLLANGANQSLSTEDGFTPLAVAMQQGHDKVVTVLLENDTRGKVRLPALHIAAKKDDVKAAKLLLENEHNPDVTSKSGFTPLHIASHYGNQQIANLLIQKGADVNYAAKHNITPLHVAAKWGKTNMVALLLENGASIEAKTRDGLTPLHCAARSGHEQVVDMLLEKGAPISSKTKNGLAPLHMAAQGDHVDAARILLYHRAPVDEVTVDYLTALHVAAHCGHVRVAKLLLDRQADANARALNGFTPLHIACKKNRIKVVELLLKHGASIGATTESGLTPLHVASFMGCMNIVIYLLQHDANPDAPTIRGETPLHLAARANQTDIIRILLRNGAQVDARAREQQTPLHIASRLGNVDIVMLLLQHGARVDNTTKDMYTALHIAAKEGQDEVAGVLIDHGASINSTTKKGFTPLHLASKYGNLKVAKLLVQKEAPVDAQGKNGVTPLHVASHYDHQNVALLLLDKGASPHAIAKNGHTPLHIAARKNQMDIANTLLEYGAQPNAESKAGFTPLHLSAQEGHTDISSLLLENKADPNHEAKNGLTPLHLCAQEDRVPVAEVLVKNGAHIDSATKAGYTPLHIACHYGQANMVRFLLKNGANVESPTSLGYTPLHQAAQQGHANIVNILLENKANPDAESTNGQTPLNIAQKLGYITVIETLKVVTTVTNITTTTTTTVEEKYKVQAPEAMQETFISDSEEEGGEDAVIGDQTYRYLTADEMKSLGDDSLPIDVTRDERVDSNKMVSSIDSNMLPPQHIEDSISPEHVSRNYVEYIKKYTPDNIDINRHPINIGFLVSFLVDARGGAMRGCRHSGVRVIVPPRCAPSPTRITCRYVRPQRTPHPPPLMEGEALASRVLELGPVGAKFLGPVIIEVPHFAALRGKEREIVILRSDNGESWKEHTVDATEEILNEVLHDSFEAEDLNQMEDVSSGRITRIVTQDFPQYFAVVSRIRQEVHAIGPEGGMVSSTVVPQVQAIFPEGALTKKIKVGLQAQPIDPELTAKLLGHGVAVSPVVTVEPRRRKFHKAIRLNMPVPTAHSQGMINQYSGSAPTLRLLCSITGGTTRAQWEDVTGSTPLTFVNDVVSFTTTVSARFWLIDCRNIGDATKMATELYKEAIHVPFMAKFVVFAKRVDPLEARLRVFCMTDDKEDKTLEHQEHFTEVAKSRDVEVLEGKSQYIEFAGNLVPITKSGEQLQFSFRAFRENRLPFSVRVKDQHAEAVGRCLFMREAKVPKGEPPQQPICILNIVLPDDIVTDTISLTDSETGKRHMYLSEFQDYYRPDPRLADMSNLLGDDWVELAHQLGLTSSEINVIKSEYPESIAKQAQSMLRMWLSQSSNKAQTNTLENALRRIGREDIIPQCLNVEQPSHTISRIKEEEIGYRLKKKEEKEQQEKKKMIEHYDKYSAEEKVVEKSESEEEDNFDKTVTERREQIEKRLSAERVIPASSQRREIVQEISTIKRQSLVEDKIAEAKHKVDSDGNIKPDSVTIISDTAEVKTTLPSDTAVFEIASLEKPDRITRKVIETHKIVEQTITHIPGDDSQLLKDVSSKFEQSTERIINNEDLKSPKFSKTPPPSPADFLLQNQATSVQERDASKDSTDSSEQKVLTVKDAAQQETSCGLTQAEPSLTPTDSVIPQPKPRTVKVPDIPLDFSKTQPKSDKIISPVRDDLLDEDEDEFATYSDKKKFWENVSKETAHKRMSLHEVSLSEKEVVVKKRTSIHEIGQPPIPKPRSILQTPKSLIESELPEVAEHPITDDIKRDEIVDKETSAVEIKIAKEIEEEKIHAQEELTSIIEDIESTSKEEKMMSEYQSAFTLPSDRKDKFPISEKSQQSSESQMDKDDSLDSDKAQKGSSQFIEHTGYISDSEDVENVISDSEIEDRVPQIRERQMSVFAPPVTQRKTIYERSASLPTEDLYEVSRNLKHLKEKYEQQIKHEMIEEHYSTDNEEDISPERKSLAILQEEIESKMKPSYEDGMSQITEEQSDESSEERSSEEFGVKSSTVKELRESFEHKTHMYDQKFSKTEDLIFQITPSIKDHKEIHVDITDVQQLTQQFLDSELKSQESPTFETDITSAQYKVPSSDSMDKVSVKDLAKSYEKQISSESVSSRKTDVSEQSSIESVKIPKSIEEAYYQSSVEETYTHKVDDEGPVSLTHFETHKETGSRSQQNILESQPSKSSDKSGDTEDLNNRDDSYISKDSMEVHVDKSEIEDSEKLAELEQETYYESKSFDSLNAEQSTRPTSEDIPEITVTLSGKQRRISEESDESSEKVEPVVAPIQGIPEISKETAIRQPEEHIQETIWETTVETQVEPQFEEKVDEIFDTKSQIKLTEEFIATEKVLEQKEISPAISEQAIHSLITDSNIVSTEVERIPSEEEDEISQVEHIIMRQSTIDRDSFEHEDLVKDYVFKHAEEYSENIKHGSSDYDGLSEKSIKEIESAQIKVQHLDDLVIKEPVADTPQKSADSKREDKEEDLSSGLREESDLGSEIHMDHSDSVMSDRIKSESHSEIEKIILDTFHHMKVDPNEAKRIASQLIEEIENEIQNRSEFTASEATQESVVFNPEVSSYIKQLAETNGLDEREVELVESVLSRRQRELAKLARGDTQASSMEITDEDLRHSGGELTDYTHILQQQIGQLEAEKAHDINLDYDSLEREGDFEEKSDVYKIDEKHKSEKYYSEDSECYENFSVKKSKKDIGLAIGDSLIAEKTFSEGRNVILEEDETISESSVKEHGTIDAHIDAHISESAVEETEDSFSQELKTGDVDWDTSHQFSAETEHKLVSSDKITEEVKSEHVSQQAKSDIFGHFESDRTSRQVTDDFVRELKAMTEKEYSESTHKSEQDQKQETSKLEKISDDVEVFTTVAVDKKKSSVSTETITKEKTKEETVIVTSKSIEGTVSKLLDDIGKPHIDSTSKIDTFHRTSSSDSKSSLDSAKSPDKKDEIPIRDQVILRKTKSEVDSSSTSSNLKLDRRSGVEFEAYSSSGESHYQSFEMDSARSRPCSSDVEGIVAAASSEYETALTSTQEYSAKSHITSTDYHTAISSISSKESMKSLDSESSGNLASVEISEHSETLVPSTSDIDGDILDSIDQQLLEDAEPSSGWTGHGKRGRQISDLTDSEIVGDSVDMSEEELNDIDGKAADVPSKMKRSAEMTFQPEPKVLSSESPQAETIEAEEKFAHSLDDGSVLSISMSSTSSTGAQRTVIEILDRHDAASGTSEHHSLDDTEITMRGSQESLPLTPTLLKSYDISTSTPPIHSDFQIENVTITTSSIKEDGVFNASTQITSEPKDVESVSDLAMKTLSEEPKKKGHRRTESTMIGISLPSVPPEYKEAVSTEKKEKEAYESEKDIDEREENIEKGIDEPFDNGDISHIPESASDIQKSVLDRHKLVLLSSSEDQVGPELAHLLKSTDSTQEADPIQRPTGPEPQIITKLDTPEHSRSIIDDFEQEFSSKTKEVAMELQRKRSTSSISDISKEMLEKRDSHGKSSTTSSEKSSFEEAEADAVFNMVAHISPAHKVKQIIPILEDEDAEKHELEMREKAKKELEERRALMKDISPGFIPDITVTEHMTPDLEQIDNDDEDDREFKDEKQGQDLEKAETSEKHEDDTKQIDSTIEQHMDDFDFIEQKDEEKDISDEIMTSSMMKSSLISSFTTESEATTIADAGKFEKDVDSQSSDSFEMLEKPDIIDDFVVIEEVAKEAQEFDSEGKSVRIDKQSKKVKKHDEEIEQYLVKSAPTPLTGIKYYPDGSSSDELGFEFEDSPPKPTDDKQGVVSTRVYGFEYDRELEANKRWIEQQFQGNQAAMIAAGYGYEMEFERGPLEDIKEEDINDFAASSYGSHKESGGSLGSAKDSYSSTPDYDVLAGRKYFTRSGEPDDISMSSLQEFENLEQAMSLEMKRFHQGQGSDSSSSGSFKVKFHPSKNNTGDDISVSSLKEFEGLEKACIQAHKIEIKAKEEEAMLAQIDEGQESIASESESCETAGTEKKATDTEEDEDYEKRMCEIDEIIKQAQTNVERFVDLREAEKTESLGRGDSVEEVSKVPDLELDSPVVRSTIKVQWKENEDVMITSTDSLDFKQEEDRRDSTDSLDAQATAGDIMTASTDSIEFQAQKARDTIMTDSIEFREDKSYIVSSDSLEFGAGTSSGLNIIQSDSIDDDGSRVGVADHSISSTGKDFSSSVKDELVEHEVSKEEKDDLPHSIASVDPTSSTATHATMHCETDSVFSGSFTSGGSNTMVSSTDTIDSTYTRDKVDVGAAVRRVWFDEDLTDRRVSEYIEEYSRPYVSETVEHLDDDQFSHTIHRKVELPPEVHKVTFTGPQAEEQLKKFMQDFNEGEDVQETQEIDEHGNIHTKRIVQKRFIIKGDTEHPMSKDDIEEYFKELNQPDVVQDRGVISRTTEEAIVTKTTSDDKGITQTTIVKKFDLPDKSPLIQALTGEEQSQPSSSQQDSSRPTVDTESIPEIPDKEKSKKVAHQHDLSEEMKELLKEMEKQSKK